MVLDRLTFSNMMNGVDLSLESFLRPDPEMSSATGLVNIGKGFMLLGSGTVVAIFLIGACALGVVLRICQLALSILTLSKENFISSLKELSVFLFIIVATPLLMPIFYTKVLMVDMIFSNFFARYNERNLYNSPINAPHGHTAQRIPAQQIVIQQPLTDDQINEGADFLVVLNM